jgi:imidazolonepropionase-like amidohydrolase
MDIRRGRRWARAAVLLASVAAVVPSAAQTQSAAAFINARIIPVDGPPVERGTLVVQAGKIAAVGPVATTTVPSGATVVDLAGHTILPGLVDTHSHIGAVSGGDSSAPIQPDVRVLDAIDVRASSVSRARAGGITTVNIMPGSGHLLSGQTIYLKLRAGTTIDELAFAVTNGRFLGGLKMANGTNSLRPASPGPFPGTRAKSAALVREQFVKAIEYRDKVRAAAGDATKLPPRDLGLEAIVEVLDGSRIVHFHTHRHDDILTVLRLAKEFGFTPVLHHVSEGWKVANEIARAGASCSLTVVDSPGGKLEAMDMSLGTAAVLAKANVPVAFNTDDFITDSRLLLRSAALAVRAGLPRDTAIEGLTLAGARMLGLSARVGSLTVGKDADFVVLSGDPLSVYTRVEQTWVEGRKVFDLANPADHLIAVGGYGATRDEVLHTDDEEDQ